MLNHKERWIFYYDKILNPHPDEAPNIPLRDIMELLEVRQNAGESVKLLNKGTAAIRINKMRFDDVNDVVCLLVQYSDQMASDPVFANLETGTLRVEPKLEGEGVAISAHVVISLVPNQRDGRDYLMLLEDVPGIGKTKLDPFFTSEYKQVSNFIFRNEEDIERPCRPIVESVGYKSQTLREGLETGTLLGIDLVRLRGTTAEFDEPGAFKEISRHVEIKASRPFVGNEALGLINRMKERASAGGYNDMRVKFKRPEGKQRSILMGTAREDAGDALFTKCELISVEEPLPQCLEEIRDDVVAKMTTLLLESRAANN